MQKDDDGVDRVISYQFRLLKAVKLTYPVHNKELLSIKYALVKFRVHILGTEQFFGLYGSRITADRNKLTAPLA